MIKRQLLALRQRRAFRDALPDALSLLANAVRSGHSLSAAVRMTALHSPGVVGDEWTRALAESDLGVDLFDALDTSAERMRSQELRWLVVIFRINRDVGGELGPILVPLRDAMRDRAIVRHKARALTAEARLSAVILAILPFAFAGYLVITRPDYVAPLALQPLGHAMTVGAVGLLIVGIWWMRLLIGDNHK